MRWSIEIGASPEWGNVNVGAERDPCGAKVNDIVCDLLRLVLRKLASAHCDVFVHPETNIMSSGLRS